jgi:hypothetical protein
MRQRLFYKEPTTSGSFLPFGLSLSPLPHDALKTFPLFVPFGLFAVWKSDKKRLLVCLSSSDEEAFICAAKRRSKMETTA